MITKLVGPRPKFEPNGAAVRTQIEWQRAASNNGHSTGRSAAKQYADHTGWSASIWKDGHVTLRVVIDGQLETIRFG